MKISLYRDTISRKEEGKKEVGKKMGIRNDRQWMNMKKDINIYKKKKKYNVYEIECVVQKRRKRTNDKQNKE